MLRVGILLLFALWGLEGGSAFAAWEIPCADLLVRQSQVGAHVYVFKHVPSGFWTVWARNDRGVLKKAFWAKSLVLRNADRFAVDEAKRQQVVRDGKRMPHAGIWGLLAEETLPAQREALTRVFYNPFLHMAFVDGGGRAVTSADRVYFYEDGSVWVGK